MSAARSSPEELVKRVQDQPLEFAPGAQMNYSNTGYVLLGMVIEKASGMSYAEFLAKNIFDPAGMKDTGYDDNAAILPHRAAGYSPGPGRIENAIFIDMSTPFSAGALHSTVGDLLRWERFLFGKKLLSATSLEKMTLKGKGDYGMGLGIGSESGRKIFQHGGGIPGFNAQLTYYPETDVTIVALSNLNGPGAEILGQKLGALAHGDLVVLMSERKSITVPVNILRKYVGQYDFEPGRVMNVTLEKRPAPLPGHGRREVSHRRGNRDAFSPRAVRGTVRIQEGREREHHRYDSASRKRGAVCETPVTPRAFRSRKSRIRADTSNKCVSSSQWPPSSRCSSASGRSRR